MTTDKKDCPPGPSEAARESSHPTVCGQPVSSTSGATCVLRTSHKEPHQPLPELHGYTVVATIEPASGAHDRCSLCFKGIDYGQWMLLLPETRDGSLVGSGPIRMHQECAAELRDQLGAFVELTGPAPDPSDGDPEDWR